MSQHHSRVLARRPAGILLCLLAIIMGATAFAPPAPAAWSNGNWTEVFTSSTDIQRLVVSSDANGGTLAMIINSETYPARGRVSRLSRTGTELWGTEGIQVPFDIATSNQEVPIAVAPDGTGGSYIVWAEAIPPVYERLRLSRLDANGTFLWFVTIAAISNDIGQAGAMLVLEPGVGVTVGYVDAGLPHVLRAQRYDPNGALLWATDVNTYYEHNIALGASGPMTQFDMQSDGQGGVLFSWLRWDPIAFQNYGWKEMQIGVQRIDSTGQRMWGNDGHLVWDTNNFLELWAYQAKVTPDGGGGAFVVTSGGSKAYAQHVSAAGSDLWASGGIMVQSASTWGQSTDPQICSDQTGGFILIQALTTIYAQRVDGAGTLLWGPNGIVAAAPSSTQENYSGPSLAPDGFGGAVVGYRRWDNGAESVGGLRLDAFGNLLWANEMLFSATGTDGVLDVHVVADGIGGAKYVWKRRVPGPPRKDDVYALGVNGQGLTPDPMLYGLVPDAGEPGDILPTLLFGDYIDETFGYELRHGPTVIPFTGVAAINPGLVGGWLDLSGAPLGAWDLFATQGGADRASLADAFGVGLRPGCTLEMDAVRFQTVESFGTARKMHFGSDGQVGFAYMFYNSGTNEQLIYGGTRDDDSMGTGLVEVSPGNVLSDLAFTVDSLDRSTFAYIRNGNTLVSHTYDWTNGGLVPSLTIDQVFSTPLRRPVIVPMNNGLTRIVVEADNAGVAELWEAWDDGSGLNAHPIPQTGINAHDVDLAPTEDGLAMVYLRDSWFPGVSELCLQHFRNGAWEAPVVLTFALSLQSPTVASDRAGGVLVAWILDNSGNGSAPLLQTTLVTNDVVGPIRTRATAGTILRVQVDAQGPQRYFMMTQETGQPMQIFLRGGDGNVFYPTQRLNSDDDTDWPSFAAQYGGLRVAAMWQTYNSPSFGDALLTWFCRSGVMTAVPDGTPTVALSKVQAVPNPFNPRTRLEFELSTSQWVKVAIFDSRGRRVRLLHDATLSGGPQSLEFDGRDDTGSPLASGVYFAQLRPSLDAPGVVKLTLLK